MEFFLNYTKGGTRLNTGDFCCGPTGYCGCFVGGSEESVFLRNSAFGKLSS